MAAPMEVQVAVQSLPRLSIQWDWKDAFRNQEKAWVSCSTLGQPSVYGYVKGSSNSITNSSDEVHIEGTDGFTVPNIDKRSITVAFPDKSCTTKFINSSSIFNNIHKRTIRCIDVSCGGGIFVTSADDGMLTVWNTTDGSIRQQLAGHITDVNCCRFFPSGEVIASGGADFQIKIWSAIDGSCPATLLGHTGGVTDIAIIEKGRNIVSCSRDGSARLWDCGQSKCLDVIYKCDCPINACAVGDVDEQLDLGSNNSNRSEREIGTDGKLLLLAQEDGVLAGVGLRSQKKLFDFKSQSAFNCCAFVSEFEVCGGTESGQIWILDIRNTSSPVAVFQRSKSPILSVLPFGNGGLLASSGDGSCFHWRFDSPVTMVTDEPYYTWELTGPDSDHVYKLCAHRNTIYTVCRDKRVRKYILSSQETS